MSARDEFGPPKSPELLKALQSSRIKDQIQGIGKDLQKAGVTQDGHGGTGAPKNTQTGAPEAKKDLAVKSGDRPAMSPCDGKAQAQQAGQAMKTAGVQGGQSQSASKQFSPPAKAPSPPAQSRSR